MPRNKKERREEREQIITTISRIQELAKQGQIDSNEIMTETFKRIGDLTVGMILIGTTSIVINNMLKGETQGELIGLTDDLVTFIITLVSIISKPTNDQNQIDTQTTPPHLQEELLTHNLHKNIKF